MECIDTRIISSRARSRHNLYKILELYALCIFKDEKFALDGCVIVTKAIGEQEAARWSEKDGVVVTVVVFTVDNDGVKAAICPFPCIHTFTT